MISQCPHCSAALKFSPAHTEKLKQALAKLPEGRFLKFACPKCKVPIELYKDGTPRTRAARDTKTAVPETKTAQNPATAAQVVPPPAPDISWLSEEEQEEEQVLDDVPTALVLLKDPTVLAPVTEALQANKFQIYRPESVDEAIESMRFKNFAVVVYAGEFGDGEAASQDFHKYMSNMSMNKRRNMFYVLIGSSFRTLYDLQALTLSANLVVNTNEVPMMNRLLKKGLKEYEGLFAPYISMLKTHGKN